jgi:antitoxin PrlF
VNGSVSRGTNEIKNPETRVTSQGQVSVPASIRKKLGVEPGSTLEWIERDGEVIVKKRSGAASFDDIHKILFRNGPPTQVLTVDQMDQAIANHMRKKYGRR